MMVMNYTKLYNPGAYGSVSTSAYKDFLLSNALTSDPELPLMMVMKYTKLYDPRAYSSISILPTRPRQTDGQRYTIIHPV
jgi:hypothetical protein